MGARDLLRGRTPAQRLITGAFAMDGKTVRAFSNKASSRASGWSGETKSRSDVDPMASVPS